MVKYAPIRQSGRMAIELLQHERQYVLLNLTQNVFNNTDGDR